MCNTISWYINWYYVGLCRAPLEVETTMQGGALFQWSTQYVCLLISYELAAHITGKYYLEKQDHTLHSSRDTCPHIYIQYSKLRVQSLSKANYRRIICRELLVCVECCYPPTSWFWILPCLPYKLTSRSQKARWPEPKAQIWECYRFLVEFGRNSRTGGHFGSRPCESHMALWWLPHSL